MTTTLPAPPGAAGPARTAAAGPPPPRPVPACSWRDTLRGAATGQVLMGLAGLGAGVGLQGQVDPFSAAVALVAAGAVLLLLRRRGRAGVAYAGVVCALLLVLFTAFGGLAVLSRPQSTFDLILSGGLLTTSLLGLVAVPGALRDGASPASALAPRVAGAFIALLVVVGVVAGLAAGSERRRPGDLSLDIRHFAFTPTGVVARPGTIAVFIRNRDLTHHDFTINGLVKEDLAGRRAGRAVFVAEAGTYRFYCTLHPGAMEGTLTVTAAPGSG